MVGTSGSLGDLRGIIGLHSALPSRPRPGGAQSPGKYKGVKRGIGENEGEMTDETQTAFPVIGGGT
jgi:hypothetical protein